MTQPETPTNERPEPMRVWLFGGFRVSVGVRTVENGKWRLRKAASLVKLLALASGHRLHREQVMDLLWPHLGKRAAANNLRQVLYGVRRILAPTNGYLYLASDGESLVLCPRGDLWVDVDAFEEAAITARRTREPAANRAALDLYAGDLLPEDRYEAWAEDRREGLRQLYLSLLVALAKVYEEGGEHESALDALRKTTAEEPTLEEAHASLMRLYALSGRPEQALVQFERLRDILARMLGLRPAEATGRLRDEIAAGRFPLSTPDEPPPVEDPGSAGEHNLPEPMTSFVGREREMVEIKRTLALTRLLTLTGAGGSGKTRLALEVARDLVGAYPDGVWLVELATLSAPDLIVQEVAGTLEVKERPDQPLSDTLVDALRGKALLLVLDNCEHLVDSAAQLIDTLLSSCPHLKVLSTSREMLGVSGEVNLTVRPLTLPAATNGDHRGKPSVEDLVRCEAVRLFVDRARLRLPDFGLTEANAGVVSRVCRKLDGIPLAIELATARMGALAVEQVAQRLEWSLDVLKGQSRTAEARQQTLKATLDWSHDLLSEAEQVLFMRLSVFAGGWTLEAAEAVCSGDGIEQEAVLDLLGGLVDKSLVVAGANTNGAMRYRMLEPIRQYALDKLEESLEGEKVRRHHARFYLTLAEEAEPGLNDPDRLAWLQQLRSEQDNMRAALSWAVEREEAELALQLAGSVRSDWSGFGEVRGWLEAALGIRVQASVAARLKALSHLKWFAFWQGDFARAETAAEESLNLSRQTGDAEGVAASLRLLADVAIQDRGDYQRAMKLYEEGLAVCRERGYTGELAQYLADMAEGSMHRGDLQEAKDLLEEAAVLLREKENGRFLEFVLESQGWVTLLRGEHKQARAFYEEGLALCRQMDNKFIAISNLEGLACIAAARGEDKRAARIFGAAHKLNKTVGNYHTPAERALREPYLTSVRSRLDETSWEAAFAEGRAMTFEEAVEYALSEEKPYSSTSHTALAPPPRKRPGNLTHREQEVAGLVARGLTNRRISAELSISERTAANHVARILRKLGLRSRAQIPAHAGVIVDAAEVSSRTMPSTGTSHDR